MALVAGGGILYTAGAVVYALRRPDPAPAVFGYHEIFHVLVIAAAAAAVRGGRGLRAARGLIRSASLRASRRQRLCR